VARLPRGAPHFAPRRLSSYGVTAKRNESAGGDYELRGEVLRQGMLRRVPKRIFGAGQLRLPSVPALLEHYVETLGKLFALHGRAFTAEELDHLRGLLVEKLAQGFSAARNSVVVVDYQTDPAPKQTLSYTLTLEVASLESEYADWVSTRAPPYFGKDPDCKVMDVASSLGAPADVPVLDIGAGAGRNALALARAGFPTDAVEQSPALATILREALAREGLTLRLFEGDFSSADLALPAAHYRLLVASELVSDFRDVPALVRLFERASELLDSKGVLVLNAFVPVGGYQPDAVARQLSYVLWSTIFLREELKAAAASHGLVLLSEESVFEYEKARLPARAWPPTSWFEQWTRGVDTFDVPVSRAPVEMRWLTFRKSD
jgi:SAM-dependent methyltransferase